MPSRAELRLRVEQILRGVVIAALTLLLWQSLRGSQDLSVSSATTRGINRASLEGWTTAPDPPARLHLNLDKVPVAYERAWLRALNATGSALTWSGEILPLAIEAQRIAAPTGGTKLSLAAPAASDVIISDDVGPIDTLHLQNGGASASLAASSPTVMAELRGSVASTTPGDSLVLRRVLVIGSAGWESKFVVAALEEDDWKVDALIRVAPGTNVTQGATTAIDTSRYSAVIALDSAASPFANRIGSFVRSGGGLVLSSDAASLPGFDALRAGSVGISTSAANGSQPISLATLGARPMSARSDAIPLETRGANVTLAARRVAAGRVVQSAYEDTWRWRMNGGDDGVRDHRHWWTTLVSNVAYAPAVAREPQPSNIRGRFASDPAPFADLVATIGPETAVSNISTSRSSGSTDALLFFLVAIALVGEIVSRRLRGAG